jgi:hypothetical protein
MNVLPNVILAYLISFVIGIVCGLLWPHIRDKYPEYYRHDLSEEIRRGKRPNPSPAPPDKKYDDMGRKI